MRHSRRGKVRLIAVAFAVAALCIPIAASAADATNGEKVLGKCKICHDPAMTANRIGPALKGLFGRKAGTAAGYTYSAAMKSSGITWSEDKLKAFLAKPAAVVPGTRMAFVGISKPQDLEDLVAYLKSATR